MLSPKEGCPSIFLRSGIIHVLSEFLQWQLDNSFSPPPWQALAVLVKIRGPADDDPETELREIEETVEAERVYSQHGTLL